MRIVDEYYMQRCLQLAAQAEALKRFRWVRSVCL